VLTSDPLLAGIVLPAVVCGLLYLTAWQPRRRSDADGRGSWGPAVAVGVGFVSGFLALEGWPGLPPLEVAGWLPWLALGAVAAGLFRRSSAVAGAVLRLALAFGVPLLTLWPLIEHRWSGAAATLWIGGLAGAVFVVGGAVDALAASAPGSRVPLGLGAATTGAAGCIVLAGSARLFQLTVILAATLGTAVAVSLWRRGASHDGGSTVAFALLAGLLVNGFFYLDDLPAVAAILLAASPLGLRVGIRSRRPAGAVASALAVLLPVAVALALTVAAMPDDPYGY